MFADLDAMKGRVFADLKLVNNTDARWPERKEKGGCSLIWTYWKRRMFTDLNVVNKTDVRWPERNEKDGCSLTWT